MGRDMKTRSIRLSLSRTRPISCTYARTLWRTFTTSISSSRTSSPRSMILVWVSSRTYLPMVCAFKPSVRNCKGWRTRRLRQVSQMATNCGTTTESLQTCSSFSIQSLRTLFVYSLPMKICHSSAAVREQVANMQDYVRVMKIQVKSMIAPLSMIQTQ